MIDVDELREWTFRQLVDPLDRAPLELVEGSLRNSRNPQVSYPIVQGIPVLLPSRVRQNHVELPRIEEQIEQADSLRSPDTRSDSVHPFVRANLAATGGYLYRDVQYSIREYPIPRIRNLKSSAGQVLLDVGCNWGRWTFAAAKAGFPSIGVDPSLESLIAAKQICDELNLPCLFVVADARFLPFQGEVFTNIFSYSVVQHFSKSNAAVAVAEFARVLRDDGELLMQMPNRFGVRSLYHQGRRGFSPGEGFDVRYYTLNEIQRLLEPFFSSTEFSVDGYFGLGIQPDDRIYMPGRKRLVIDASETMRSLQQRIPGLIAFADSVYSRSLKG